MVLAPPRVLPRSLAPSGVLRGGRSGPGSPLLGLGLWGWRQEAGCGKRKHYEDECYHKQRLSAKLKAEDPGKGSGKGGGKGNGNDSGKGKSKVRGKEQDKNQGGKGGGANRRPDKDNKNPDKNGGNPNPSPGGNSEPFGEQSGPTTRSQTQAQREQGAKREHEGGDDGNAKKRSRFMRMARKLRNKGFEVTCPAEF